MFRRIEFIHDASRCGHSPAFKSGIMFTTVEGEEGPRAIFNAWEPPEGGGLRGNTRGGSPSNMRFYFTEKGWRKLGRNVVAAARKHGQRYRVIAVKETDAQIAWRDKHSDLEVALQPARRR